MNPQRRIILLISLAVILLISTLLALRNFYSGTHKENKISVSIPVTTAEPTNFPITPTAEIPEPLPTVDPTVNILIKDWKTYDNPTYGYQFKYPADWTLQDNGVDFTYNNRIFSSISVFGSKHNFSVQVVGNKPGVVLSGEIRGSVMVSDIPATAFIFPEGYECYDFKIEDCSFFEIPIWKDSLWYRIGGGMGANEKPDDIYLQILSTFKFTR